MGTSSKDQELIARAEHFVLEFGKYKGTTIEEVPSGYLKWLAENSYQRYVRNIADAVWRYREQFGLHFEE